MKSLTIRAFKIGKFHDGNRRIGVSAHLIFIGNSKINPFWFLCILLIFRDVCGYILPGNPNVQTNGKNECADDNRGRRVQIPKLMELLFNHKEKINLSPLL